MQRHDQNQPPADLHPPGIVVPSPIWPHSSSPQHQSVPSALRAQVCWAPAETSTVLVSNAVTWTGKNSRPVLPLPISPSALWPQHQSVPSALRTQVWLLPTVSWTAHVEPPPAPPVPELVELRELLPVLELLELLPVPELVELLEALEPLLVPACALGDSAGTSPSMQRITPTGLRARGFCSIATRDGHENAEEGPRRQRSSHPPIVGPRSVRLQEAGLEPPPGRRPRGATRACDPCQLDRPADAAAP